MIDLFTVRGCGEPQNGPTNMLTHLIERLDPSRFRFVADITYPASIGVANAAHDPLADSLEMSCAKGVLELGRAIRATPNVAAVVGYSLGAYVVSNFLEDMADDLLYTRGCELAFAATVADPRHAQVHADDDYGISGGHRPWPSGLATFEIVNPFDGICCCPPGSPLRHLSDELSAFTFAVGGGWSADLVDRLIRRRWQPVSVDWLRHPIETWQAYATAAALVEGYAVGGQHTTAYVDNGHLDRLAVHLNHLR